MKKVLLAGVAGIALVTGSAHAADLSRRPVYKAPAPAMAPAFSWTGCYIGGNIGGGWGRTTASAPSLAPGISLTGDTSGVIGGGQVGCNYQFAPNWVIGIEGDGEAADIKGDAAATVLGITGTAHARTDWIASVTGRLGWTWDRWMLYAKGGAAWAGDKYSADIPIFAEHIQANQTRAGWTVGGGVEWAFWQNWSAKVEYDFYDFGRRDVTFTGTIFGVPEVVPGINVKQTISTVKFGVNYRFGPVAGAY
jgi:outer membrane immunogenic protein